MNKRPETIDEYIETFPPNVQSILAKIKQTIRDAAPEATEAISYQIPTFKLRGTNLVHFAGWKTHIAVYPIPAGTEGFQRELSQYKGGKGTVRFPLGKPIPYELVEQIVRFRMKET